MTSTCAGPADPHAPTRAAGPRALPHRTAGSREGVSGASRTTHAAHPLRAADPRTAGSREEVSGATPPCPSSKGKGGRARDTGAAHLLRAADRHPDTPAAPPLLTDDGAAGPTKDREYMAFFNKRERANLPNRADIRLSDKSKAVIRDAKAQQARVAAKDTGKKGGKK